MSGFGRWKMKDAPLNAFRRALFISYRAALSFARLCLLRGVIGGIVAR